MERLKFSDSTDLKLDDLASVSSVSKSDLARIAMRRGINELEKILSNKRPSTDDQLKIEALKAKQ